MQINLHTQISSNHSNCSYRNLSNNKSTSPEVQNNTSFKGFSLSSFSETSILRIMKQHLSQKEYLEDKKMFKSLKKRLALIGGNEYPYLISQIGNGHLCFYYKSENGFLTDTHLNVGIPKKSQYHISEFLSKNEVFTKPCEKKFINYLEIIQGFSDKVLNKIAQILYSDIQKETNIPSYRTFFPTNYIVKCK